MNLTELLAALSNLDEVADVDFDPTQVVGDVKDKVDAIHKVLGRLDAERTRLKKDADKISAAWCSVDRQYDRLEEYLSFSMRAQGFTKLPGNVWRVQFNNAAPALVVEREATADDLIEHPALVKRTVTYVWKKDEIKGYIAAGNAFPLGKIVQGQYLKFYPNKGSAT